MEASTIWSALTASVLAGVPALSTHFVAFSTEVVDLTDQVDDPLGLLLEVQRRRRHAHRRAGCGTPASWSPCRPARWSSWSATSRRADPLGPLLAEVRALVEAGCHVLGCA